MKHVTSFCVTQEWLNGFFFKRNLFPISTVSKRLQAENIHENFQNKKIIFWESYNRLKIHV